MRRREETEEVLVARQVEIGKTIYLEFSSLLPPPWHPYLLMGELGVYPV